MFFLKVYQVQLRSLKMEDLNDENITKGCKSVKRNRKREDGISASISDGDGPHVSRFRLVVSCRSITITSKL